MKKEYFVNKEFNRRKRRSAIVLGAILALFLLFMAATFAVQGVYLFAGLFAVLLIIPILSIPSGFKNFPVHDKPIVVIENGEVTSNGKTYKIKDIKKVNVIVELPTCKDDKKDLELLNNLKSSIPEDEFFGTFDIIYGVEKGKAQIEYAYIDHVVDALYAMVENGLKKYDLKFTIKKNIVVNECDLKKVLDIKKQENSLDKTSKKDRTKQLL